MSSAEAAVRNAWKRRAERLRDDFERLATEHRDHCDGWPPIEFAATHDGRSGMGNGYGEPLFEENLRLAVKSLHLNAPELPCTICWRTRQDFYSHFTRTYSTNYPLNRFQEDPPASELTRRLSKIFRIMQANFQAGGELLDTVPFKLPGMDSARKWRYDFKDEDDGDCWEFNWLSILFEASWGEAHLYGLKTHRLVPYDLWENHARPRTDQRFFHNLELQYEQGRSPECFHSVSRDVLNDSARLIEWLVSLCDAEATSETPKPVEPQARGDDAGDVHGNEDGEPPKIAEPPADGNDRRGGQLTADGKNSAVSRAVGVYEWAVSSIQNADAMTIPELYQAIQNHPQMTSVFLEKLPNNSATFGQYLRRGGIKRYNVKGERQHRPSRRSKKR